jgi:hypothetical protein
MRRLIRSGRAVRTFFFHVYASGEFFPDKEGVVCENLRRARQQAIRLTDIMMKTAPQPYDWRSWSVLVAEADGPVLLTVPFVQAGRGRMAAAPGLPAAARRRLTVLGPGQGNALGAPANERHAGPSRRLAEGGLQARGAMPRVTRRAGLAWRASGLIGRVLRG